MKLDNSSGVICAVVVLILALCMLRYHILQKEKFAEESLFNNKLTKEFEKKFKFTYDCSAPAFKKKMLDYFKLVRQYREQETDIYNMNDEMKKKYDAYQKTMKNMESAKTDLDFCINSN